MRICALIAARNEGEKLERCIRHLRAQGLCVAVIDNESSDHTSAFLDSLSSEVLVHREFYPYPGFYDWTGLLAVKEKIATSLSADWLMHVDADEIPEAAAPFRTISEGVEAADHLGYNAINFDEFVFVPEPDDDSPTADHPQTEPRHYYYFAPEDNRLIRLWKRQSRIDLVASGGHAVSFPDRRIYPRNFPLRHYIARSRRELAEKYRHRVFSPAELARGWHMNRVGVGRQPIRFPAASQLHECREDGQWETSKPWKRHFFDPRPQSFG
jgi:glycosyltransferase involved in cell wall biosynthesis